MNFLKMVHLLCFTLVNFQEIYFSSFLSLHLTASRKVKLWLFYRLKKMRHCKPWPKMTILKCSLVSLKSLKQTSAKKIRQIRVLYFWLLIMKIGMLLNTFWKKGENKKIQQCLLKSSAQLFENKADIEAQNWLIQTAFHLANVSSGVPPGFLPGTEVPAGFLSGPGVFVFLPELLRGCLVKYGLFSEFLVGVFFQGVFLFLSKPGGFVG
jgi:hypothetical protein